MHNATNAVLDRIASRNGLRSDYALAKAFGRQQSFVTNYRSGRSQMSDDIAVKAANLADEDPALLLIELQIERTKSPEAREQYLRAANMLRKALAA